MCLGTEQITRQGSERSGSTSTTMLRPADEIIMMILKPGTLPTTRRLLLLALSLIKNLPAVFQTVFFSITVVRGCTWNLLRQFNSQPGFHVTNFKTCEDLPLGAGHLWVQCMKSFIQITSHSFLTGSLEPTND